jgi:hypothetical protein
MGKRSGAQKRVDDAMELADAREIGQAATLGQPHAGVQRQHNLAAAGVAL